MSFVNFGVPKTLVNDIIKQFPIDTFIETGTYQGETSYWASTIFKKVHTIEIAEVLYQSTKEKYKNTDNIKFHLGDSKDILKVIIQDLKGPALFWLDGHWCGRDTGGKDNLCPVMDELKYATSIKDSVILIDDLRCFLGPLPFETGEEYPPVIEVVEYVKKQCPNYYITFHDDTIVCVPPHLRNVVDNDWKSNFSKRYPNTLKNRIDKFWWRLKNLNFNNEYK